MNEGETGGIPGETQGKLPKRDRVAVCLNCTNEWVAHTGNAKKPSKCPICGSKRCAWKDETAPNAENPSSAAEDKPTFSGENTGETGGIPGEVPGETGETNGETDFSPEDPGEAVENEDPEDQGKQTGEPKTDPEELPTKGGFPLVLALIGLVLLGTLAGVGWFLGRRPKRRTAPIRTDHETPVQMNLRFGEVA
ncbi:hypothetical protein [uncultured Methanocorpusculum sp.]|nr:hypothetical protein [uncultured Methanocorpusculum sp.]